MGVVVMMIEASGGSTSYKEARKVFRRLVDFKVFDMLQNVPASGSASNPTASERPPAYGDGQQKVLE